MRYIEITEMFTRSIIVQVPDDASLYDIQEDYADVICESLGYGSEDSDTSVKWCDEDELDPDAIIDENGEWKRCLTNAGVNDK